MSEPVSFPDTPLPYPGAPVPAGASVVLPLLPSRYAPMPLIGDGHIPDPGEAANQQVSKGSAALPEPILAPGDSHDYQPFSFYRVQQAVEHNASVEAVTREPDSPRTGTAPVADQRGADAGATLQLGLTAAGDGAPAPNPGTSEQPATGQVPPTTPTPIQTGITSVTDVPGSDAGVVRWPGSTVTEAEAAAQPDSGDPGHSHPETATPGPDSPGRPMTSQFLPTALVAPLDGTTPVADQRGADVGAIASALSASRTPSPPEPEAPAPNPDALGRPVIGQVPSTASVATQAGIVPVANHRKADAGAVPQRDSTVAGARVAAQSASGTLGQTELGAGAPERSVRGQVPPTTSAPTSQPLQSHLASGLASLRGPSPFAALRAWFGPPVPSGAEEKQSPAATSEVASDASLLRNDDFVTPPLPTQDSIVPVAGQRGADAGSVRQPGSTASGVVAAAQPASGAPEQHESEAPAPDLDTHGRPVTSKVPHMASVPPPRLLPSHLTPGLASLQGPSFGPPVPSGGEGKQSPSATSEIASVASLLRNDDFAVTLVPTRDSIAPVADQRGIEPGLAPAIGTGVPTTSRAPLPLIRPTVEQASVGAAPRQAGRHMDGAANEPPPLPTIRVTIGRVEVRAAQQTAPAVAIAPARAQPALSLDDILRTRGGRQ